MAVVLGRMHRSSWGKESEGNTTNLRPVCGATPLTWSLLFVSVEGAASQWCVHTSDSYDHLLQYSSIRVVQ